MKHLSHKSKTTLILHFLLHGLLMLTLAGGLSSCNRVKRLMGLEIQTGYAKNQRNDSSLPLEEQKNKFVLGVGEKVYGDLVNGVGEGEFLKLLYGLGQSNAIAFVNHIGDVRKLVELLNPPDELTIGQALDLINAVDENITAEENAGTPLSSTDTIVKIASIINGVTAMNVLKKLVHGALEVDGETGVFRLGRLVALVDETQNKLPLLINDVTLNEDGTENAEGIAKLLRVMNEARELRQLAIVINETARISYLGGVLLGVTNTGVPALVEVINSVSNASALTTVIDGMNDYSFLATILNHLDLSTAPSGAAKLTDVLERVLLEETLDVTSHLVRLINQAGLVNNGLLRVSAIINGLNQSATDLPGSQRLVSMMAQLSGAEDFGRLIDLVSLSSDTGAANIVVLVNQLNTSRFSIMGDLVRNVTNVQDLANLINNVTASTHLVTLLDTIDINGNPAGIANLTSLLNQIGANAQLSISEDLAQALINHLSESGVANLVTLVNTLQTSGLDGMAGLLAKIKADTAGSNGVQLTLANDVTLAIINHLTQNGAQNLAYAANLLQTGGIARMVELLDQLKADTAVSNGAQLTIEGDITLSLLNILLQNGAKNLAYLVNTLESGGVSKLVELLDRIKADTATTNEVRLSIAEDIAWQLVNPLTQNGAEKLSQIVNRLQGAGAENMVSLLDKIKQDGNEANEPGDNNAKLNIANDIALSLINQLSGPGGQNLTFIVNKLSYDGVDKMVTLLDMIKGDGLETTQDYGASLSITQDLAWDLINYLTQNGAENLAVMIADLNGSEGLTGMVRFLDMVKANPLLEINPHMVRLVNELSANGPLNLVSIIHNLTLSDIEPARAPDSGFDRMIALMEILYWSDTNKPYTNKNQSTQANDDDFGKLIVAMDALSLPLAESHFAKPATGRTCYSGHKVLVEVNDRTGLTRLIYQGDGNLVLYRDGASLWSSGTLGSKKLCFESDGNLVIYGTAWETNTANQNPLVTQVTFQGDCNMVAKKNDGTVVWSTGTGGKCSGNTHTSITAQGQCYERGTHVFDTNGGRWSFQGDGNLVLYVPGNGGPAVWASNTVSSNTPHLCFETTGNLVMYKKIWSTNTSGAGVTHLALKGCNSGLYDNNGSVHWQTATACAISGTEGLLQILQTMKRDRLYLIAELVKRGTRIGYLSELVNHLGNRQLLVAVAEGDFSTYGGNSADPNSTYNNTLYNLFNNLGDHDFNENGSVDGGMGRFYELVNALAYDDWEKVPRALSAQKQVLLPLLNNVKYCGYDADQKFIPFDSYSGCQGSGYDRLSQFMLGMIDAKKTAIILAHSDPAKVAHVVNALTEPQKLNTFIDLVPPDVVVKLVEALRNTKPVIYTLSYLLGRYEPADMARLVHWGDGMGDDEDRNHGGDCLYFTGLGPKRTAQMVNTNGAGFMSGLIDRLGTRIAVAAMTCGFGQYTDMGRDSAGNPENLCVQDYHNYADGQYEKCTDDPGSELIDLSETLLIHEDPVMGTYSHKYESASKSACKGYFKKWVEIDRDSVVENLLEGAVEESYCAYLPPLGDLDSLIMEGVPGLLKGGLTKILPVLRGYTWLGGIFSDCVTVPSPNPFADRCRVNPGSSTLPVQFGFWRDLPNYDSVRNCAKSRDGKLDDDTCGSPSPMACRNLDHLSQWATSTASGSWERGEYECAQLDGNYEFGVPVGEYESVSAGTSLWTNYNDIVKETDWRIATQGWNRGEPNGNGSCAVLLSNGAMDDQDCGSSRPFLCQKEEHNEDPGLSLEWVTAGSGAWMNGENCPVGYYFAYPDREAIRAIRKNNDPAAFPFWVNYTKRDGSWKTGLNLQGNQRTFWNAGEPNNNNGVENCAVIRHDGFWNDVSCVDSRPYVCVEDNTEHWVLTTTTGQWLNADDICKGEFGEAYALALPRTGTQNKAIADLVGTVDPWINFSDVYQEGDWQAVTGWGSFATIGLGEGFWNKGEPNNWGKAEDCAATGQDGRWNDIRCDAIMNYACQSNDNPAQWRVSATAGVWHGARHACPEGYSFSVPETVEANEGLISLSRKAMLWLNYSDYKREGAWRKKTNWDDGITFWAAGEPNGPMGPEWANQIADGLQETDCASIDGQGLLHKEDCNKEYEHFCVSLSVMDYAGYKGAWGWDANSYYKGNIRCSSTRLNPTDRNYRARVASVAGASRLWVHLQDKEREGEWRGYDEYAPERARHEACAEMQTDGTWNDAVCGTNHRYACQSTTSSLRWTVSDASGEWKNGLTSCPEGYFFSRPGSVAENDALRNKLMNERVWINYTDQIVQGNWQAIQDWGPRQHLWEVEQPNDEDNQDCAILSGSGKWDDRACDENRYYYACHQDASGTWKITASKGVWENGMAACQSEFGTSFSFSVPDDTAENEALAALASYRRVWLNYDDLDVEGYWRIGRIEQVPLFVPFAGPNRSLYMLTSEVDDPKKLLWKSLGKRGDDRDPALYYERNQELPLGVGYLNADKIPDMLLLKASGEIIGIIGDDKDYPASDIIHPSRVVSLGNPKLQWNWTLTSNQDWDLPLGVGDVNSDGTTDLLIINGEGTMNAILFTRTSADGEDLRFSMSNRNLGNTSVMNGMVFNSRQSYYRSLGLGDVDADGRADTVVTTPYGDVYALLTPPLGGTLTAIRVGSNYPVRSDQTSALPLGFVDFDKDGLGDRVMIDSSGFVWVFLNPANGGFAERKIGLGTIPTSGFTITASNNEYKPFFPFGGADTQEHKWWWLSTPYLWDAGEPNNANNGEHCATISNTSGRWVDDQCNRQYKFACQSDTTSGWILSETLGTWTTAKCPAGYHFAIPANNTDSSGSLRSLVAANGAPVWLNLTDSLKEKAWFQGNLNTAALPVVHGSGDAWLAIAPGAPQYVWDDDAVRIGTLHPDFYTNSLTVFPLGTGDVNFDGVQDTLLIDRIGNITVYYTPTRMVSASSEVIHNQITLDWNWGFTAENDYHVPLGVGDFNLDQRADIFILDGIGELNVLTVELDNTQLIARMRTSNRSVPRDVLGDSWWSDFKSRSETLRSLGVGDINYDRRADILVVNEQGEIRAYRPFDRTQQIIGNAKTACGLDMRSNQSRFKPLGVMDINLDGRGDILIYDTLDKMTQAIYVQSPGYNVICEPLQGKHTTSWKPIFPFGKRAAANPWWWHQP